MAAGAVVEPALAAAGAVVVVAAAAVVAAAVAVAFVAVATASAAVVAAAVVIGRDTRVPRYGDACPGHDRWKNYRRGPASVFGTDVRFRRVA